MINCDKDAKEIIKENIKNCIINEDSQKIMNVILKLFDEYSFVDNQTYPRPSHPLKKKRMDPYFTLVAIILSLRTTLENEMKAVENFISEYKSIYEVVNTKEEDLSHTIKTAGMPQKKAKTIINISNYIIKNYDGNVYNIKKETILATRNELLRMPGIGDKSADCMLELGFDLPSMVIDINVYRTVSRLFGEKWAESPDYSNTYQIRIIKNKIERALPSDYLTYQIVHTMLLLQGKYVCKSKCKCLRCHIREYCEFYKKNKFKDSQMTFIDI